VASRNDLHSFCVLGFSFKTRGVLRLAIDLENAEIAAGRAEMLDYAEDFEDVDTLLDKV